MVNAIPQKSQSSTPLSGRVVLLTIRRHPFALMAIIAFAAAASAAIWFFLPVPKVTAAVTFHIASQTPTVLKSADPGPPFATYKLSQGALIKSRLHVLNPALKEPGVRELQIVRTADPDPLNWLETALVVDTKGTSELMRVSIAGDNGEELVTLLAAIQKVYIAEVQTRDGAARHQRVSMLEKSKGEYQRNVEIFQRRIDEGLKELRAADPRTLVILDALANEELRISTHELSNSRDQLSVAQRELVAWDMANHPKEGEFATVILPESSGAILDRELLKDRIFLEMEAAVGRAAQDLARAEKEFDSSSSAIAKAKSKLAAEKDRLASYRTERRSALESILRESLSQAEKKRKIELENKVATLTQRVLDFEAKVKAQKEAIANSNSSRVELEKNKRLLEENVKLSSQMTEESARINIELKAPARVTLHEDPFIITGIEGNRRFKYSLIVGIGLFLVGFVGLVLLEHRRRRFTHPDEVTSALGIRLFGTIPPTFAPEKIQTAVSRAAMVEAIDTTRNLLIHDTADGPPLRTLLIASAVSGEGKTTLSGHLAISLARAGFRTLLIDGDLHRPSIHHLFQLPESPGLCEFLKGEIGSAEAVQTTSVPGLSVLAAGQADLCARQLLVGQRWSKAKKEFESQFDFLVIDTAPILMVSDSLLLAREADGVVLSTLLGVSQVGLVMQTAARLRAVGVNLIGAVVNGVWNDAYQASYKYGYGSDGGNRVKKVHSITQASQ